jgi:hypothetical protein
MQRLPIKRLQALQERRGRERPFRFVWTRRDATDAEIEEARNRLVAAGRASADDRSSFSRGTIRA